MNKAKRIRKAQIPGYEDVKAPVEVTDRSLVGIFKVALTRPWIILFDPISFLAAIYLSVVYGLLYMLFSIYPIVFQEKVRPTPFHIPNIALTPSQRGWNAGVGQLPLLGTVMGACIGGAYVFYDTQRMSKRISDGHVHQPEDRLPMAMVGGIAFPITMLWFAWSGNYNSVHWIVCTIGGAFLSASILLIFVGYLNYLADTYLMYAASALAANTVARSAAGAAAPLFTNPMFEALGVGGGGSLIGGLACLLAPIPFLFQKYGQSIREKSRFAPMETQKLVNKPEEKRQSLPSSSGDEGTKPGAVENETPGSREAESSEDRFLTASGVEKAEPVLR